MVQNMKNSKHQSEGDRHRWNLGQWQVSLTLGGYFALISKAALAQHEAFQCVSPGAVAEASWSESD
jgi:hypothetical protein